MSEIEAMKVWHEAVDRGNLDAPICCNSACPHCEAAASVISDALQKAREEERAAMVEAYNQHDLPLVESGYKSMMQAFLRNHYLSALAEEDGKEL